MFKQFKKKNYVKCTMAGVCNLSVGELKADRRVLGSLLFSYFMKFKAK